MSEHSESYHHATVDRSRAEALLRRSGRPGWVLAPGRCWTPIVLDHGFDPEPDPALLLANRHLLCHYVNAEDEGWILRFHQAHTLLAVFEGDVATRTTSFDGSDRLRSALPVRARPGLTRFLGSEGDGSAVDGAQPNGGERLAAALGFGAVSWISGRYLADQAPPGAVRLLGSPGSRGDVPQDWHTPPVLPDVAAVATTTETFDLERPYPWDRTVRCDPSPPDLVDSFLQGLVDLGYLVVVGDPTTFRGHGVLGTVTLSAAGLSVGSCWEPQ